jgi:hypothetical protein
MEIEQSAERRQMPASRDERFEKGSNVILERELHPMKEVLGRDATEEGTQIDESEAQSRNAESSIKDS